MNEMSDEEFKKFLEDNRERVDAFLSEECDEKECRKDCKDRGPKGMSYRKDRSEDFMKDLYHAFMNPDAHKHFVRMGIEFFMGVSEILDSLPAPEHIRKFREDVSESKCKARNEICRANPSCSAKKQQCENIQRIEIE